MKFGKNANAAVKDTVTTQKAGEFTFKLRYSGTSDINNVDLYVNGSKVETMKLSNTNGYSNWKYYEKQITLKQGDNKIELKANAALPSSLYLDCMNVEGSFGDGTQTVVVNEPEPISGTLIKNLVVADTENAADWTIQSSFGAGSKLYGDRDFTVASSSTLVNGAEYIRTACDSKMYSDDLATFKAGADMYVYAAVDDRVASALTWLNGWTSTGSVIASSNNVTFTLYQKQVKAGDTVILGTNGGLNESANYIVFASTTLPALKGDVNQDGKFDVADVVLLQRWLLAVPDTHLADWKAADLCEDDRLDVFDLCMMKRELLSK